MQKVSKITCINNGGFDMKFRVRWYSGEKESGWTGTYPNPKSHTIDLTTLNMEPGTEVWPEIHAELGKSHQCDSVEYDPSSEENATYKITGTTLNVKCSLQG